MSTRIGRAAPLAVGCASLILFLTITARHYAGRAYTAPPAPRVLSGPEVQDWIAPLPPRFVIVPVEVRGTANGPETGHETADEFPEDYGTPEVPEFEVRLYGEPP